MRKSFQEYLINKYDVNPKFLYRPFYAYPTQKNGDNDDNMITKTQAVSISRVDYGKHTEIIIDANKLITSKNSKRRNIIKIYGPYIQNISVMIQERNGYSNNTILVHLKSLLQRLPY